LGRLAVEIAVLLRGKQKPNFMFNLDSQDVVVVKNVGKVKITGRKLEQKEFFRHSGYAKGLHSTSLAKMFQRDPAEVLRRAVYGMLPKNKLRSIQIKRLKFE
jgi:large subunit ribosomal protein L13